MPPPNSIGSGPPAQKPVSIQAMKYKYSYVKYTSIYRLLKTFCKSISMQNVRKGLEPNSGYL